MEYSRLSDVDFKKSIDNRVFVTFLVKDVSVRLQRDKVTKFITLNMVDKDKVEEAKIFGASDSIIERVTNGKVFNAAVDVKSYDKAPNGYSCIIYSFDESDLHPSTFADWVENIGQYKNDIENKLKKIIESTYGKIAYKIITDNWAKFSTWAAASGMHHTKLGGLLQHTAEVVRLSENIAGYLMEIYGKEFINEELLYASAILHDIGKINEYSVDTNSGCCEYSVESSLESHIMSGISMIEFTCFENKIGQQEDGKDAELALKEAEEVRLLKHCIAAHHGKLEWGSPIKPSVPEAHVLHVADGISAEMYRYNKMLSGINGGESDLMWVRDGHKVVYKETSKNVVEYVEEPDCSIEI